MGFSKEIKNTYEIRFVIGVFLLFCMVLLNGTILYADEDIKPTWKNAFASLDKGDYKNAIPRLENILKTKLTKLERLEIHHALGYAYEKSRNRPKAVGHYVQAITKDYILADSANYRLAKLYENMNNDNKAIEWYSHLVRNYQESLYTIDVKWSLAELHLKHRQYAKAKEHLIGITDHPTHSREATYALARCEEGLANYTEAFNFHQKLIRKKQSDKIADNALGKLKMLTRDHSSLKLTVEDKLNCGLVLYHQNKWSSAVNEFTPLTRSSDPKLKGRAFYHLGQSNQARKWYNTAMKNYNTVIALGSKSDFLTRAHYQIAQIYRKKGSLTTAVNLLESFVKKYSWSDFVDKALYDIAQIQDQRGKVELVLDAYSRLIDVAPGSEYADWAAWKIGWLRFDEKRYEESYKAFEGLKDNFPDNRYAMGAHFWMAKIRERQNKPELAKKIYAEVAKARYWYYSARAKAILDVTTSELEPKALQDSELPFNEKCPEQLPTMMKLRLYEDAVYHLSRYIDNTPDAAKECYFALITCYERLSRYDMAREIAEKALVSKSFNHQASNELAQLRRQLYPLHYEKLVEKYSKQYNVDASLVYAMILEESRYRRDAISWAGAIGLMQIMPSTGRELARQLKIRRFHSSMLKIPEVNIRMGTKYIGELNSMFDGDAMLVSGAYNGGPGRMKRWLESKNIKDIDEFVEKITIRETRLHIKKVINSYDNYVEIYGQTEVPAVNAAFGYQKNPVKNSVIGRLPVDE